MDQEITIIYEKGVQGWWVTSISEVPGAVSQGKTKEEAGEMVLDALRELSIARLELASPAYGEDQPTSG